MAFSSSSSENNFGESFDSCRIPQASRSSQSRFSRIGTSQNRAGQSTSRERLTPQPSLSFDILAWYPKHQSCLRYFLDHAQHDSLVQAFAAFINILLPYQRRPDPICSSSGAQMPRSKDPDQMHPSPLSPGLPSRAVAAVSLIPYLRRLVVTGMDVDQVLFGFFGDDWRTGVGPQIETERRNYLFTAKSGGWAVVKRDYDMNPLETVPFLAPLRHPSDPELEAAEKGWSEWLAMEDWMVGSRAPASPS